MFIEVHEKGRGGQDALKVLIPARAVLSVAEATDGSAVIRVSSRTIIMTVESYASILLALSAAGRMEDVQYPRLYERSDKS